VETPDLQRPCCSSLVLADQLESEVRVAVGEQPLGRVGIVWGPFRHAAAGMHVKEELAILWIALDVDCLQEGGLAGVVLPGDQVDASQVVEQQAAEAAEVLGREVLPHGLTPFSLNQHSPIVLGLCRSAMLIVADGMERSTAGRLAIIERGGL